MRSCNGVMGATAAVVCITCVGLRNRFAAILWPAPQPNPLHIFEKKPGRSNCTIAGAAAGAARTGRTVLGECQL